MKGCRVRFWAGCMSALYLVTIVHSESLLKPLPIAKIKHPGPIDFEKEILPILKQNCLACHNQTRPKGAFILETPQSILKGGDTGPGIVPKKPKESLLLRAAAHQVPDLEMPPPDNKVAANALTPEELGLIQLWIERGAEGEVSGMGPIAWQALPPQLNAIYAVALTQDGHWAACGRGNRIFIYDIPCRQLARELGDEGLPQNAAHCDTVNSLAFSPNGELLASGGYREVKLWRRERVTPTLGPFRNSANSDEAKLSIPNSSLSLSVTNNGLIRLWDTNASKAVFETNLGTVPSALVLRPDGKFIAAATGSVVRIWKVSDSRQVAEIKGNGRLIEAVAAYKRELVFAQSEVEYQKAAQKSFETNRAEILARQKRADETDAANTKLLIEKQTALTHALALQNDAIKMLDAAGPDVRRLVEQFLEAETRVKNADKNSMQSATNLLADAKSALEKLPLETKEKRSRGTESLIAAKKTVADVEDSLRPVRITKSAGENELQLASTALQKSSELEAGLKHDLETAIAEARKAQEALDAASRKAADSEKSIVALAFSPDNGPLFSASSDGTVQAWNAETGAFCATLMTMPEIKSLSFDRGGKLVTHSDGGTVTWNTAPTKWTLERVIGTGADRSPLADRVNALRFTADGRYLITGGGEPSRQGEIKVWDLRDGHCVREFKNIHSDSIFALDLSPDGKYLASAGADRFARVTDFETGKVLKNLEGHTHHVLGVAWKHDGRTLFTAGADNVAKTWDFASAERRKNIEGFSKEVTSVSFIGFGNQALVTAGDGQVLIVNDEGTKIRSMNAGNDYFYAGIASPDASTILAGGMDGILRFWNGSDGKLVNEFKPPSTREEK